jgi:hypothetical protein
MSIDEYRDIEATLEEMSDPEARRLLKKGTDEVRKGRTKTVEDIFGEALFEASGKAATVSEKEFGG